MGNCNVSRVCFLIRSQYYRQFKIKRETTTGEQRINDIIFEDNKALNADKEHDFQHQMDGVIVQCRQGTRYSTSN